MSMAINQVNAWEQFNSAVNAARARTSVQTVAVSKAEASTLERSDRAPLSSKVYGPGIEKKAPQVTRGTLFDAYA